MKVLFVNTNESHGGAARAALRIMRGVQHQGVEVQLFVKNRQSQAEDVVTLSQFIPHNVFFRIGDWIANKIKNKWQHYKWRPYKQTKRDVYLSDVRSTSVHGALQKMDYDIVHLHWINERFLDIRELSMIKKPIVWTLHDTWPFCGVCHYFADCEKYQSHCGACPMLGSSNERDLSYEAFEKKVKAYEDLDLHIIAPSKWIGDCAKKSALLGRFPITVIPNGLDVNLYSPKDKDEITCIMERQENATIRALLSRVNRDNKTGIPIILYGAMNAASDSRKGFASLLAALKILDSQGCKANLVVFGAEEQELPMSFKHIDVTFIGYIGQPELLAALYSIADVMVVPSYSEVFGQTASEAMACATPVVAFRCTGIQDVVAEGCGYLAEPYSPEDLANGIRYCIENNPDNVLGNAARESVVKRFAIDIVSIQYKQLYESLL